MYRAAAQELMDRLRSELIAMGLRELEFETIERSASPAPSATAQRLIPAYSKALLQQAEKNPNIVALDADLILDTGLIPFRDQFPDRLIECGIAEQDMVSMAGGMALNGLLPIVHSFACFLSTRPNEQIYNNATEHTKVIYVGSLSGVVPGGPGHSHQSVRDISALGAMPGMALVEPSCDAEVGPLLDWCVNEAPASSYIRLISVPWDVSYTLPIDYRPARGKGVTLLDGEDVAIIAYGPVLLSNAMAAAKALGEEHGIRAKVINLPWLNQVDSSWLATALAGCKGILSLDNHYTVGGQGDAIARAMADAGISIPFRSIGLIDVPPSGTNAQVLSAVGLDAKAIVEAAKSLTR